MARDIESLSDLDMASLQCLLDAFPSAPLELIASAYTQANRNPNLAAHFMSLSLSSSHPQLPHSTPVSIPAPSSLHVSPSHDTNGLHPESHPLANPATVHNHEVVDSDATLSSRPPISATELPRPSPDLQTSSKDVPLAKSQGGQSGQSLPRPTLKDYFPSSPEKKAWVEPLAAVILQKNVSLQNQQDTLFRPEPHQVVCSDDFPRLEKGRVKEKAERAASSHPLRCRNRSKNRSSVAFGLASSACSRIRDESSNELPSPRTEVSANDVKPQHRPGEEASLWPTETETFLLSTLGDECTLGIEAVRDVLGHYNGDLEKSLEVLLQMSSSSLSIDNALKSASKLGIIDARDSNFPQHLKDTAAVEENAFMGGRSNTTKEEICSTARQLQTFDAFEEALLKQEDSGMKWVVESLCKKYPHAEMGTILEVLRTTNFDYNDAEKMLQEACLDEGKNSAKKKSDPREVARMILESLFAEPQEAKVEVKEDQNHPPPTKKTTKCLELSELHNGNSDMMPKWEVVTCSKMDCSRTEEESMQMSSYGNWDDYERHHASAKQHWKTMESYLKAANASYAALDISKAELLTEKGNMYKQLAMEAKDRANRFLLEMKRRPNESDFTLDLHEQHVTQALQLLRLHLKSFSSISSCNSFTVITGSKEERKSGCKKIKHEVTQYLQQKGYDWVEISPFCLQVNLEKETIP